MPRKKKKCKEEEKHTSGTQSLLRLNLYNAGSGSAVAIELYYQDEDKVSHSAQWISSIHSLVSIRRQAYIPKLVLAQIVTT